MPLPQLMWKGVGSMLYQTNIGSHGCQRFLLCLAFRHMMLLYASPLHASLKIQGIFQTLRKQSLNLRALKH